MISTMVGLVSKKYFCVVYGSIYHRLQFPPCEQINAKLNDLSACGIPPEVWIDVDHSGCAQECPASSFSSSSQAASVMSSYVSQSH